jgi:hypothetical protein
VERHHKLLHILSFVKHANLTFFFIISLDGQNMAKRVSKQHQKITSLLKKAVSKYNEQEFFTTSQAHPKKIEITQVLQPGSAFLAAAQNVNDVSTFL